MRVLLPLLALGACSGSDGARSTRNFPVAGAFDAVTLAGPDDVQVVAGNRVSISATGPQKDLDRLDISVDGTTLVVTRESGVGWFRWSSGRGVTVTVTTPRALTGATLKGSGDLTIERGGGTQFDAALRGSGDLTVAELRAERVRLALAGSGDLKAAGTAGAVRVDLSGSGEVDARNLAAGTAEIELKGSGNISARASQSAKVTLKGSGNVSVAGTGNCTIDKRGSGNVRCEP